MSTLDPRLKKLLKYGVIYAQAADLQPYVECAADLDDEVAFTKGIEIAGFLTRIGASAAEVRAALMKDRLPVPHSLNRENYAAGRDLAYWVSGYAQYRIITKIAQEQGINRGRFFDFGGSTGRVFRHFFLQTDAWDVWSCDFKASSVDFNLKVFPSQVRAFLNTSYPSLPLPDSYFDLIAALSVFTHINEAETSWLLELRRVLRVGGIACLTILNEASWQRMESGLRQSVEKFRPDIAQEEVLPPGKTVITFREDDPYNCNVLHSDDYIYKNWGRYFKILEIQSLYTNTQAMVVCQRID